MSGRTVRWQNNFQMHNRRSTADGERGQSAAAECAELPGGNVATSVLRFGADPPCQLTRKPEY
jgi:hypothetical protein